MGKNSTLKKSQYLGMSLGTASQRLTRRILFRLLQKNREDYCFKCKNKIETIEELTVEHIKPWLNIEANLFWNLDNIAFSHHKCNIVHTTNRRCKVGFFWCQHCRKCLGAERFGSPKDETGRKRSYCNSCRYTRKKAGLSY